MSFSIFRNHITNCIKQSQIIKNNFSIHKDILAPGIWNINQFHAKNIKHIPIGKIDYYSSKKTPPSYKKIIKNIIELYFFNFRIIISSPVNKYSYMYISRAGIIKIFNFKDQLVLTSCHHNDQEIFKNINSCFLKFFKTPGKTLVWINNRKYIQENFITSKPLEALPDKDLHVIEVFKKYIGYLNLEEGILQPGIFLDSIKYIYKTTSDLSLKAFIEEKIQELELIDHQILYYNAHGDFSLRNIYFHEKEYFVIDIDDFGIFLPGFFDVVHLCKSRLLKPSSSSGLYDEYLNLCFKKSFISSIVPENLILNFIILIFNHSPHYAKALSINSHTTLRIDSSWSSFKSKYLDSTTMEQLMPLNV